MIANQIYAIAFALLTNGLLATAATISGNVTGSDGSTVISGLIVATRHPTGTADRRNIHRGPIAASIQSNGSIQIHGLLPGVYTLCTQTPRTTWLEHFL